MAKGGTTGDWLLIEELFARGEPGFVDALRRFDDADVLGAFAPRWFADVRPEARALLSEEWQPVRQEGGVAATHTLHANAGRAESGGGRLHADTAHFVQQHANVTRLHCHFFIDFVLRHYFDVQGRVLQPYIVAGRVNRDLFMLFFLALQFDFKRPLPCCIDIQ